MKKADLLNSYLAPNLAEDKKDKALFSSHRTSSRGLENRKPPTAIEQKRSDKNILCQTNYSLLSIVKEEGIGEEML